MKWFLVIIENEEKDVHWQFATRRVYDINTFLMNFVHLAHSDLNISEFTIFKMIEEFYCKPEVTCFKNGTKITIKEIER